MYINIISISNLKIAHIKCIAKREKKMSLRINQNDMLPNIITDNRCITSDSVFIRNLNGQGITFDIIEKHLNG